MSIVSKWIIILTSSLDLIFGLEIKSLESGVADDFGYDMPGQRQKRVSERH